MPKGIAVFLVLMSLILSVNVNAAPVSGLAAYFKFNGDYYDSSGNNSDIFHENTPIIDDTLYLNGIYGGTDYYSAKIPINGFDYEAFTVSMDFYILEDPERPMNIIITGGASYRWFCLYSDKRGQLFLALNNLRDQYALDLEANYEKWHNIKVSYDLAQKRILVILDNRYEKIIDLPSDFTLDVVGTSFEERDKHFLLTNPGNGQTFYGYIDNLMIYTRSFCMDELEQLGNCNDAVVARYDESSNTLEVPCFVLGNSSYRLDMKVINANPVQLELTNFLKNNTGDCDDSEVARYDTSSNILQIPCLGLGNSSYWLGMKVINTSPVQLELTDFGENGHN